MMLLGFLIKVGVDQRKQNSKPFVLGGDGRVDEIQEPSNPKSVKMQ